MHHIAAYSASIVTATLTDLAAVPDAILATPNNHFIFEDDHNLLFAAAFATNLQRARIVSPTNRQITLPFIRPTSLTLVGPAEPRVADYRATPFSVKKREELAVEAIQNAGVDQRVTVLIGLEWGPIRPPRAGNVFTMRFTSVTAATANAWSLIVATPADNLPEGLYEILGLEVQSTNAQAARVVIENQYPRPGSMSIAALGSRQHDMFKKGGLGVWGQFHSTRLPNFEVLCNGADAAHEIYMDIMRVG